MPGPVFSEMAAICPNGICAPEGVLTSTRCSASMSLPALNSCGHRLTAHGRHQDVISIVHSQSVSCELIAFEIEIQKISARRPLSKHTGGAGDILQRHLDLPADFLDFAQVRTKHLDAERRAHTGG